MFEEPMELCVTASRPC
uniref:Uncharacterized protein n=1 Tax=Anguilla anguilla TaxID=7936 RepID=A0A0E9Q4F8_ANGAN